MSSMLEECKIQIIYPDLNLKHVKSSKLKRLDQIVNYNAEM